MTNFPAISVVLPVYNAEKYLGQAIESILKQSMGDFEFIIINDGSTDRSSEIMESYKKNDNRIRLFVQDHQGLIYSLNKGCKLAQAAYIAYMNADDVSLLDRLKLQYEFLERHQDIAIVGGQTENRSYDGTWIEKLNFPLGHDLIAGGLNLWCPIASSAAMFRSEVPRKVGGYRSMFLHAEDYDFWIRATEIFRAANLPETIYQITIHRDQVSICNIEQQAVSTLGAKISAQDRLAGKKDRLADARIVTKDLLLELGLPEKAITERISFGYEVWMRRALMVGDISKAESLYRTALANGYISEKEKTNYASSILWGKAVESYKKRKMFSSFFLIILSCFIKPASLKRVLSLLKARCTNFFSSHLLHWRGV